MPKQKIINLITDLHNTFGDDLASPQQRQLLEQVVMLAHKLDEPDQALGFNESVALLLHEVGEDHPHAAALLRQVVKLLGDMGYLATCRLGPHYSERPAISLYT